MSNRIVKLPSVESFGRLTPDKWLLLKTLEESAEMVEAGKRLVKGDSTARRDLLGEWADVLQTLVNVATAFISPTRNWLRPWMIALFAIRNEVDCEHHQQ